MKLTKEQAEEVLIELRECELEIREIAKIFNVSSKTISLINKGKAYKVNNYNYPVRERTPTYKEPGYRSEFWESYIPEPQVNLDGRMSERRRRDIS